MRTIALLLSVALATPAHAAAARAPAAMPAQLARIADEGFNHSQVMQTSQYLDDRIGGRMTGSPAMRAAEAWTQQRFRDWGLSNVHKEGFAFGRGWSIDHVGVRMTVPRVIELRAIPIAWTPSTAGPVSAPILVAPMKRERDMDQYRGKLRGKIVLTDLPSSGSEQTKPAFERVSAEDLNKAEAYPVPTHGPDALPKFVRRFQVQEKIDAFLKAEGAVARVRQSYRDGGLLHGEGYAFAHGYQLPGVELAAEDYRRLARLATTGPVMLEIDSRTTFHDGDPQAYNIIADIPGTDPKAGYVMAGGHLDSWVAGDGAADDGAGVVSVMEAARILSHLGVRPKRTIRFALWAGEEQGLLGSKAYVEQHIARRPPAPAGTDGLTDYFLYARRFPVTTLPDYDRLAGYFNIDNGSGKLRGIYAEGNLAAMPALTEMIAPLHSMGVERVVASTTEGTDHQFMAAIGLPAFQFVQDPLDYESRVHHSSVDTYDHLKAEDLRQASVVLASILLQAADRAEPLPRGPLPTRPERTDPFTYPDPEDAD